MIFRSWSRSWSKLGWAMPIFTIFHKSGSSRNSISSGVLKRYHSIWENVYFYRNICLPGANYDKNFDKKNIFCWYLSKNCLLVLDLVFLPLKYPKPPSSLQQKGSKKDLWVILDICSKDQILSGFSKFDLDQDHQIWSRSWSFRS